VPLRDHFHPPLSEQRQWSEIHGGWPMTMATALNEQLPDGYYAGPTVHLGREFEVDIGTFEYDSPTETAIDKGTGGTMKAVWAPPSPAVRTSAEWLDEDVFEVRVYDERESKTLVAAIELVSPANKDRPESRTAFLDKCRSLLKSGVCVTIIDIVTDQRFNLHRLLLRTLREPPSGLPNGPCYSSTSRSKVVDGETVLEHWYHALEPALALTTLPLWLNEILAVPLDLEATYERTLKSLRIR